MPKGFYETNEFPPSLAGHPGWTAMSIIGLLFGTLLMLQWATRLIGSLGDDDLPWKHPLTRDRWVKLFLILAGLSGALPRLVLVLAWQNLTPWWREFLAAQTWTINALWAAAIGAAWFIDRFNAPVLRYSLTNTPLPKADASTGEGADKRMGVWMFVLVLFVAIVVTYVRPTPPHEQVAHRHAG